MWDGYRRRKTQTVMDGNDVTHLNTLMKYRLKDSFNLVEKKDYAVAGERKIVIRDATGKR
jgi:hypothetical protein